MNSKHRLKYMDTAQGVMHISTGDQKVIHLTK